MLIELAFLLLTSVPLDADRCGEAENGPTISKTQSLIITEYPVDQLVGEFPTPEGIPECARATFSIDSDGHPTKVLIVQSSGNSIVNLSVISAVKNYKFKHEIFSQIKTYTLIFYVTYNKIPSRYFDGATKKSG